MAGVIALLPNRRTVIDWGIPPAVALAEAAHYNGRNYPQVVYAAVDWPNGKETFLQEETCAQHDTSAVSSIATIG